jgi:hypothetical protein
MKSRPDFPLKNAETDVRNNGVKLNPDSICAMIRRLDAQLRDMRQDQSILRRDVNALRTKVYRDYPAGASAKVQHLPVEDDQTKAIMEEIMR